MGTSLIVQWIGTLPANAEKMGSIPWSKKIPCALKQLSPCALLLSCGRCRAYAPHKRNHSGEKVVDRQRWVTHRNERKPASSNETQRS